MNIGDVIDLGDIKIKVIAVEKDENGNITGYTTVNI